MWSDRVQYFSNGVAPNLPPGPWNGEPDKVEWVDQATNLDCLIVRNSLGALCGYVGVPPGHPLHDVPYNRPEAEHLCAHGGLTFSDRCDETAEPERGICHVPLPGRPADVWWFGFDCGHFGDLVPGMMKYSREGGYRDIAYVRGEVENLAWQLIGEESR